MSTDVGPASDSYIRKIILGCDSSNNDYANFYSDYSDIEFFPVVEPVGRRKGEISVVQKETP